MRLIAVSVLVCTLVALLLDDASKYVPPPSRCPPGTEEIEVRVIEFSWHPRRVICAVVPAVDRP